MSQENLELVRRIYELFNRRDDEAFWELVHPDATFSFVVWGPFPRRTYTGRQESNEYWRDIFSVFPDFRMEPQDIVAEGDRVVATIHNTGRGTGSGIDVDARTAVVAELRNGRLASLEVFETRAEALAAAGMKD